MDPESFTNKVSLAIEVLEKRGHQQYMFVLVQQHTSINVPLVSHRGVKFALHQNIYLRSIFSTSFWVQRKVYPIFMENFLALVISILRVHIN